MLAWPQWLEMASVAKDAMVVNALNSTARGVVVCPAEAQEKVGRLQRQATRGKPQAGSGELDSRRRSFPSDPPGQCHEIELGQILC